MQTTNAGGHSSHARHAARARRARGAATSALLGLAAALAVTAPALAVVPSTPDSTYATNGYVTSLARAGNTIYLGGAFSQVGPRTGPFVSLSPVTGAYDAAFPQVNPGGSVDAVVSDGAGGEYIGGNFDAVGGVAVSDAAHILANGTVDPHWQPSPNGTVWTLAVSAGTVYLGGEFTSIENSSGTGTVTRDYAAAVDASTGFDTGWNPSPSAEVQALVVSGATVYLGGEFMSIENSSGTGTVTRDYAAAVDATSGFDTGWNPSPNEPVYALAVSGDTVYLGGDFSSIENSSGTGTVTRDYAAAVDATTGFDTGWNPNPDGAVEAVAVSGDTVYLGGQFTSIENSSGTGTVTRDYAAAVDAGNGFDTGWAPNPNGTVFTLAVSGGTVYLGGSFTSIENSSGTGTVARSELASVDTTNGYDTGWNPDAGSTVRVVAVSSGAVLAGGNFDSVNDQTRDDAAAISAATGEPTAWNPHTSGEVEALAVSGSTVYLGGSFTSIENSSGTGTVTRDDAAAVDATTGFDTGWNPNPNGTVWTLAVSAGTVYLGGEFTSIENSSGTGTVTRDYAAAVDASTGFDTGWNPSPSAEVQELVVSGGTVYLGGEFTSIENSSGTGTVTRDYAAAVDATSGFDTGWNPSPNEPVYALAVSGDTVYLGGDFSSIENSPGTGTVTRDYAAAVDATTGFDTGWNPNPNDVVDGIAVSGDTVYLGGQFTSIENSTGTGTVARSELASVDATTGYDSGWNPALGRAIELAVRTVGIDRAIDVTLSVASDGTVYAGGDIAGGWASFSIPPANTVAPQISGTPTVGQTLTCSAGTWVGSTPQVDRYQWQLAGSAIAAATNATYTTSAADAGQQITCVVTASNLSATVGTATSAPVSIAASASAAAPAPAPAATVPAAKPTPDSEFQLLHAPYVNTTTGVVTLFDAFHNPGTLRWHVYFRNGDAGVITATTATARCPAFQVRLKGGCRATWILFGQGSAVVAGPGTVRFGVSPGAAARVALRAARRRHEAGLPVAIVVTFQSAYGGAPVSHTVRIVVGLHRH